jgi:hypothetical protein
VLVLPEDLEVVGVEEEKLTVERLHTWCVRVCVRACVRA